ncbi:SRPBCC domain-containing protein [Nitratireductor sp. ZSWI3]|uniref:SRPBCC family protein n=1 Tax=Nitratireductor sp. ZSWI3 TaxID=2966359 RepID=UPI0021500BC3|nr:SRPBCC domain-containing protein [Nitratireductor sp. ZSWI3]MCR4266671.1 SRPBCC domain-containing protein [Nitratireductor sp. ZSWI3]
MTPADEQETNETIVLECELDAPPEKVWRALTVPELAAEWLGACGDGRDEPGYEMLDALPFSRVRYAWHDATASEPDTLVTFELSPRPLDRTWFRLTHSAEKAPRAAANCNGRPTALAA